ncbi:hypothetical protein AAFF_G00215600 [Aldrovandia affinis]|uniref:Cilia- and flagella-associated protein 57 n=1 Tax=Aldrovandia affinis TaxID=143900 RepID=A0AAD7RGK0_9TELE|nr:hypothetical protein AAFF_G00215600 [Aldrovandia affinis]
MADAEPHFVFGVQSGVANSLFYFDEENIIFPSGNNCVFYDIKRKCQRFIQATEKSQGMLALAISPNRLYLAVSERCEKGTITVYELHQDYIRKRKVLSGEDTPEQEFVCVAFSHDSQYLIGQSGEPDWTLFYWMWQRKKLISTVKTGGPSSPIYKVSFNPQDNAQICVTGNGVFKVFRYAERALKQMHTQKQESLNYLSHEWVSENQVVVGTDRGQLLLFEYEDLQWKTNSITTQDSGRSVEKNQEEAAQLLRVTAIIAYSKGFVCSLGPGTVCLFQRTKDKDSYRKLREIQVPSDPYSKDPTQVKKQEIVSLCLSPSQKILATSTDRGQLYRIDLSAERDQPQFEFLSHSFHCGAITGLSTCIQKPLLATCSVDRTVRIWNFETNMLELYKGFAEVPHSVALHPTGLSILVVFSKKLSWLNLLIDDFRTFKEYPLTGLTECAFSNGGHMFAVVCETTIHLYSTITSENVLSLTGHRKKVSCILWSEDDSRLVSRDVDGAVYKWNTHSGALEAEIVHESYMYTTIAIAPDSKNVFVMGTDFTLKEIHGTQILTEVPTNDVTFSTTALSRSGRVLFCGTPSGTVMAITCPLFEPKDLFQYQGQGHSEPITKMVITFDDKFLLTISEDGCLLIWQIIWKRYVQKKDKELCYLKEIYIIKSDLEEKDKLMQGLKAQVKELKIENRFQLQLKDMDYEREVRKMTGECTQEIKSLKTKNEVLTLENERLQLFHKKTMEVMAQDNSKDFRILKADTYQKLTHEYEMSHTLQLKSQKKLDEYEKRLKSTEDHHRRALEDLSRCYESRLQENILKLTVSEGSSHQQKREYELMKKMIEEDADKEILDIRCKYEQKLREEKSIAMEYRDETGVMRKKACHVQKEMNNKSTEINSLKLELQKRQNVIEALKKDTVGFKNEIKLRNSNVEDKEKCISELRKMITDLDKSNFIMDCRIKELLNKIEPNEKTIEEIGEQIHKMEGELQLFKMQNTQMELINSELKVKLKSSEAEKHRETHRLRSTECRLRRFKSDLHHCMEFIQEPKKLKDCILKLHGSYIEPSDVEFIRKQDAVKQENISQMFSEHKDMARNAVCSLENKMARDNETHQTHTLRILKENGALIAEINSLRQHLIVLEDHLCVCENHLGFSKKEKQSPVEAKGSPISVLAGLKSEEEAGRPVQLQVVQLKKPSEGTKACAETNPPRPPDRDDELGSTVQPQVAPPPTP